MEEQQEPSSEQQEQVHDVKTLLSWTAPGRPFKKKGREFFVSLILISILIEIILFLFSQYELMLVILALVFLTIVIATVAPKNFHYKITNQGIKIEDLFYIWDELYDFYFKKMSGVETLILRTQSLPGELHIPIEGHSQDHIRQMLIQFIPYREVVKPTFMEKGADWLTHTFPLEKIREESKS